MFYSYPALWREVVNRTQPVDSRLGPVREATSQVLSVPMGTIVDRPSMNTALGFAEGLMLISGQFDKKVIAAVAPKADLSLFTNASAYGPRTWLQIPHAIEELKQDRNSRRAVVMVARHDEDLGDRPCTNSIQFLVRGAKLKMIVSMRSWDLWLGLPYDLMQFSLLGLCVARILHLAPGRLVVMAGSAHIYEQHWKNKPGLDERLFRLDEFRWLNWVEAEDWADCRIDEIQDDSFKTSWDGGLPPGVHAVPHALGYIS